MPRVQPLKENLGSTRIDKHEFENPWTLSIPRVYPLHCIEPVECGGSIFAFVPVMDFVMNFVDQPSLIQEGSSSSTPSSGSACEKLPCPVITVSIREFDNISAGFR